MPPDPAASGTTPAGAGSTGAGAAGGSTAGGTSGGPSGGGGPTSGGGTTAGGGGGSTPGGGGPTGSPPGPEPAPGLREQIGATRDSAKRLVDAHVELARAEFEEIGDAAKRASIYVGIAVGTAIFAVLLLGVGLPLFLGEWIFGSIGWGILLGLLILGAAALSGVLLALEPAIDAHVGRSFAFGVFIAIVVGIILGGNLTNAAWSVLADNVAGNLAADSRPLVVAVLSLAVIGAIIGLVIGLAKGLGVRSLAVMLAGALAGVWFGFLTAAAPGPRVGVAIAIAAGLVAWIVFMVFQLTRVEWDTDRLVERYTPSRTIQATKETIAWARERIPLSKRS